MKAAKVTIGIPTYNRAKYLDEAIRSALQQTYANLEIIVSDNGSTDETSVVLSRYEDQRIVVVSHPENRGMVSNWNACLNHATGKFFLLLSDDDILEPAAIEMLIGGFSTDSNFLSYGQVQNIQESGDLYRTTIFNAPPSESGVSFISRILSGDSAAFPSATLFRTSDARDVGGYPDIGATTDFGLLSQLALKGEVSFTSKFVARYRTHGGAETFSCNAISSQLLLVNWIKESCLLPERQRVKLMRYSVLSVYRWGRYHAFRGNQNEYLHALALLQQFEHNAQLSIALRFFNLSAVRRIVEMRRALLSYVNK